MKTTPRSIAQALVALLSTADAASQGALVDAAVALYRRECPGKSLRLFPTLVLRELRRAQRRVDVRLCTPDGVAGNAQGLERAFADALQQEVTLEVQADASIVGGAVGYVQGRGFSERLDCSVQGALHMLHTLLRSSHA